ncbi:hypothetical protein AQUCO_04200161v1 [Aquilegia coerulea]|uniref:RING-type domain-containing protein n=1 Tax=Aquilegia coerulea TaxID=218851 RepID=A0A2G5CPH8_AQUCA|nr:hypothetical protein AQUCO_04200161v1 [Aquilegia coerulea]
MVVCKCRKATKLYCFVHKVPVCGECICFPEHQICVIRTYSEWVIDGDYDWPPTCCLCQTVLEDKSDSQTTRLGCLHVIHTNCLVSHIKSYPQNTAPAGYACPACSTSIWPPKSVKDSGSRLHSKLKEAIMQTGLEKNLFGNYPVSLPTSEPNGPPPAFASDPLVHVSTSGVREKSNAEISATDIVEIDGPNSRRNQLISEHGPNFVPSPAPVGFLLQCLFLILYRGSFSLVRRQERLLILLRGKTLKFHITRMMKTETRRSTLEGVLSVTNS